MKKTTVLIILIISILIAAITVCGPQIWHDINSYSFALKANWNIALPHKAECREIFRKNHEPSFHGDGIRYHVFSYQKEDVLDHWVSWQEEERTTKYYETYSESAEAWLDDISVPAEQRPRYEGSLYWYGAKDDNSEILIIRNREEQRLYIVESFL